MWEYKTFEFAPKGALGGLVASDWLETALNDYGREGWELVNVVPFAMESGKTRTAIAIFKRKKEDRE